MMAFGVVKEPVFFFFAARLFALFSHPKRVGPGNSGCERYDNSKGKICNGYDKS